MLQLKSVVYFVLEIQAAKEWLEKLLKTKPYRSDDYFVGFKVQEYEICLHKIDEKAGEQIGNQVCYWEVENMEDMITEMTKLGGLIYRSPLTLPDGGQVCQIKSPFNFIIGVKQSK